VTQVYKLPGLIVVRRNPKPAESGSAHTHGGPISEEFLRKYAQNVRPLFRPKPRRLKRKKDEE